jgi:hypothetical protein
MARIPDVPIERLKSEVSVQGRVQKLCDAKQNVRQRERARVDIAGGNCRDAVTTEKR